MPGKTKKTVKKSPKAPKAPKPIGEVTHFYGKIGVAIVKFKQKVTVGTRIAFKGANTDFEETVRSMQFDHEDISEAPKGKEVGVKVKKKVHEGVKLYLAE